MKFAANLSHLWPELSFLDRFDAAAEAGFAAVEVLFPYETPMQETLRALLKNGLTMVLINAPPPNYAGGVQGFAAVPGIEDRFDYDMRRALRYCDALNVPMLHVMTGGGSGPAAHRTLIANLRHACEMTPKGMTLTLEPLSPQSKPGYFLNDYDLAAEIVTEVAAENLGLQFDSFHAQMIHGDAVAVYEKFKSLIRHIQIGDAPARGVPGTGDVDFESLFSAIRSSGYAGWISGEYTPGKATKDGLDWMRW